MHTSLSLFVLVLAMTHASAASIDVTTWNVTAPLLSRFDYATRHGASLLPPFLQDCWALTATANNLIAVNVSQPSPATNSVGYAFPLPAPPTSFFRIDSNRFALICGKKLVFYSFSPTTKQISLYKTLTYSIGGKLMNFTMQPESIPNQAPLMVNNTIYIGVQNAPETYNCSVLAIDFNGTIKQTVNIDWDECNYLVRQDLMTGEFFFQAATKDLSGLPNRIVGLFSNFSVRLKFSVLRRGEFQFQPRNQSITIFYELGDIAYFNTTGGPENLTTTSVACGLVEYPIAVLNGTYFTLCSDTIFQFEMDNASLIGQWSVPYNYKIWVNASTPYGGDWLLVTDEGRIFTFNNKTGITFRALLTKEREGRPVGLTWIDQDSFFLALTTNMEGGATFRIHYPSFVVTSQVIGQLLPVGAPLVVPQVGRVFVANALVMYYGVNALEGFDMGEYNASFAVNTFDPSVLAYPYVVNLTMEWAYYASSAALYRIHRHNSSVEFVGLFNGTIYSNTEPVIVDHFVCIHDNRDHQIQCVDTSTGKGSSVATCIPPPPSEYKKLDVMYGAIWHTCGDNNGGTFQRVYPGKPPVTFGANGGYQSLLFTPTAVYAFTEYNVLSRFNIANSGAQVSTSPLWNASVQGISNIVIIGDQLYFGGYLSAGYVLYQINATSGAVLRATPTDIFARFAIAKVGGIFGAGVVYLFEDRITAINATTGDTLFSILVDGIMYASQGVPVVGNDGVLAYFTTISTVEGNSTSNLTVRDALTGQVLWRTAVDTDACVSRIQETNGHFIFSDGESIIAANPQNGNQYSAFSYTFGLGAVQGIETMPVGPPEAPLNSTLVIGSQSGVVFAGVVDYKYANRNPVTGPPQTQRPSTKAPATARPSTKNPTTFVPTSTPPTTQAFTTLSPAPTSTPTTGVPATSVPLTMAPSAAPTSSPKSAAPATGVPLTMAPSAAPTSSPKSAAPATAVPAAVSSEPAVPPTTSQTTVSPAYSSAAPVTQVPTAAPVQIVAITTLPTVSAAELESMLQQQVGPVSVDPTPIANSTNNVTYEVTFRNVTEAENGVSLINSGSLGPAVLAAAPIAPTSAPANAQSPAPLIGTAGIAGVAAGAAVVVGAIIIALAFKSKAVVGAAASASGGPSLVTGVELDYVPMTAVNSGAV